MLEHSKTAPPPIEQHEHLERDFTAAINAAIVQAPAHVMEPGQGNSKQQLEALSMHPFQELEDDAFLLYPTERSCQIRL